MEVVNHIVEEILNMVFDHNIAKHNIPPPPPSPPPAPLPFHPVDSDSDYITDSDAIIPYSLMDLDKNDRMWQ